MPPPAKRGIMRNEFRQPDEQNMRQLLHQHPEDLPGLILRLAWLQGLSREEIVALKWAQVDFQERSLFLEDRTVPAGGRDCRMPRCPLRKWRRGVPLCGDLR